MKYFHFKRDVACRAEQAFYYALVRRVPHLKELERVLDESVLSKLLGKAKCVNDPRPDYFHFYQPTNMALLGEFDETDNHEDSSQRLATICHHAGCGIERTYVFRVRAHIGGSNAVCVRRSHRGSVHYVLTQRGMEILNNVVEYVQHCLRLMRDGIPPTRENRKVIFT